MHFHPQVPHHELLSRIAEHDVGYAAEVPYCESRNLTITNKVFQYLLAGIPVIATDTAGQVEVADDVPDAMRVFSAKDPAALATLIEELQSGKWSQEKARASAVEAAQTKYNWEVSRRKLVSLFETGGDV